LHGIFTDEATKNKFSLLAAFNKYPHRYLSETLDHRERLLTII